MANYNIPHNFKDLTGLRFGRWVVVDRGANKNGKTYWNCLCNCGTNKTISANYLLSNESKSCGCWKIEQAKKGCVDGEAAANAIFSRYKRQAKERNLLFELSKDQFLVLTQNKCYYCGNIASNIKHSIYGTGDFLYNGIDRMNNNLGYTIKNCVTCCKRCNSSKSDMNSDEFLDWIKRVYDYSIRF